MKPKQRWVDRIKSDMTEGTLSFARPRIIPYIYTRTNTNTPSKLLNRTTNIYGNTIMLVSAGLHLIQRDAYVGFCQYDEEEEQQAGVETQNLLGISIASKLCKQVPIN